MDKALEIAFQNENLRDVCIDGKIAEKQLGRDASENLRARLSDLRAAMNLSDLIACSVFEIETQHGNARMIKLSERVELVFVANHPKFPNISWSRVTRVRIVAINH